MNNSNMDDDDQRRNMTKIDAEETSHYAKLRRPKKSLSIYISLLEQIVMSPKQKERGTDTAPHQKNTAPPFLS